MSDGDTRPGFSPVAPVTLGDGRRVEVLTAGPADGLAVVFHHGTPFASVPYEPSAEQVWDRGVRLVSWSRPGYGGSPPLPGRRVAHAAADTAAVLDALGHDRFVTIGWSGGGPHALACGALLPGRCAGVATIAGVAPHDAEGLDWLAGMGPENIEEFTAATGEGPEIVDFLTREAEGLRTLTGPDVAASLGGLVTDVDKAALTGGFADYVARAMRASVTTGIAGWLDDDRAFVDDWGFDLRAVAVPVAIWQGREDRMVPFDHGRWLAAHVPGAVARLFDDEGHISLAVDAYGRIVDDLLSLADDGPR